MSLNIQPGDLVVMTKPNGAAFLLVAEDEGGFRWHPAGGGPDPTAGGGRTSVVHVLSRIAVDVPKVDADPRSAGPFAAVIDAVEFATRREFQR